MVESSVKSVIEVKNDANDVLGPRSLKPLLKFPR